ncbi:MAG TPA: hypothetical protein VFQ53_34425 [Kofleriaceae bacterium]|nr:hypothetical protein [Kofleriaceae bacterium]
MQTALQVVFVSRRSALVIQKAATRVIVRSHALWISTVFVVILAVGLKVFAVHAKPQSKTDSLSMPTRSANLVPGVAEALGIDCQRSESRAYVELLP